MDPPLLMSLPNYGKIASLNFGVPTLCLEKDQIFIVVQVDVFGSFFNKKDTQTSKVTQNDKNIIMKILTKFCHFEVAWVMT